MPPGLRELAQALLPALVAAVRLELGHDPLVDICAEVPRSRRSVQRACRAGEIDGAKKSGRVWVARRSEVESWLGADGLEPVAGGGGDELAGLRASLARRAGGSR